jgi:hypothetical protein
MSDDWFCVGPEGASISEMRAGLEAYHAALIRPQLEDLVEEGWLRSDDLERALKRCLELAQPAIDESLVQLRGPKGLN